MEQEFKEKIIELTKDLLKRVGFDTPVKIIEPDAANVLPIVSIEPGDNLSMLIGRGGQNLSAFEHILKLIAARRLAEAGGTYGQNNFMVDVNDYRQLRAKHILELAQSIAQRVISTQKAEALVPMSSYERRLVHTELAVYKELQTESVGEEPRRRVVVKPVLNP